MERTRPHRTGMRRPQWWRRVHAGLPVLGLVLACFLTAQALAPTTAHAIDLFPLDDLAGKGLKKLGDAAVGGLKIGVKELAKLLAGLVTALADLLVPDSFVRAGVSGIRWLVQLPQLGLAPGQTQLPTSHLRELRDSLTWVAITLLPLQIVVAGGRALLSPSLSSDSPSQVVGRAIAAGVGLLALDWLWGAMTQLSNLITGSLLRLPWVHEGIGQLLKTLVIGTGGAAAVAEFILPLVLVAAGGALLAMLLFRIALEVFASLLWVTGGLALGLSPSQLGHRLLQAWLISVAAVFVLPVAWSIVFVTGAALMLDANTVPDGASGFVKLLTQLFNLGVVLVVFVVAIKIAQGIFKRTGASLDALKGIVTTRATGGAGRRAPGRSQTPRAVSANSPRLRAWVPRAGAAAAGAASFPARHPVRAAQAAAYPVRHRSQATQEAADGLRSAMATASAAAAGASTAARSAVRAERHDGRFSTQTATARTAGADRAATGSDARNSRPGNRTTTRTGAGRNPDAARAATRPPGSSSTVRPVARPDTTSDSTPGPVPQPLPNAAPPPPRSSTLTTRPTDQPPAPRDSAPPPRRSRSSTSGRPDGSARALRWVRRNTRSGNDDRDRKRRNR